MSEDTKLRVRKATEPDVREFATWRYEPPYDIYSVTDPVDSAIAYFLSDAVNCHVIESDGALVGFITFGSDARVPGGDYTAAALDIGMGIDPALTGQGNGTQYVAAVVDFARHDLGAARLRVSVALNNPRAQRVWEQNGFAETQRFISTGSSVMGSKAFLVLEA